MARSRSVVSVSLGVLLLAAAGTFLWGLGATHHVVGGAAHAEPGSLALTPAPGESTVVVPVLAGWSAVPLGPAASYPADRGILVHAGQASTGAAPTLILSVDQLDHRGHFYAQSLAERLSLISDAVEIDSAQVCGRNAHILNFTGMAPPGHHPTA
jgi:hypothetical protein